MSVLKKQALSFYNKNKKGDKLEYSFNNLVDIDKSKNNKYLPLIVYFHLIENIGKIILEDIFNKFLRYENKLKTLRFYKNKPYYDDKEITFLELEEKIHAVEGEMVFNNYKKEMEENLLFLSTDEKSKKDIVFQNERYTVYLANSFEKCFKYSKGYSFCIGYLKVNNHYYKYRYIHGYTHYFIFDNNPNNKSEKIVVVQTSGRNNYKITNARNNTGYKEFNTYLQENPELDKSIFKPIYLSKKEKELYEKYSDKKDLSDEEFNNLSEKELYIIFSFKAKFWLTKDQFLKLSSRLKKHYLKNNLFIDDEVYDILSDYYKRKLNKLLLEKINNNNFCQSDTFIFSKKCVKEFINKNKYEDRYKLLLYSSYIQSLELVDFFIKNGHDVEQKSPFGQTSLHFSIHANNFKLFKLLINNGSDVNIKTIDGETPLHYISKDNNINFTKILINKGVDVNSKDKYNNTLLYSATCNNNIKLVKLLIANGADVNVDKYSWTPLHEASYYGKTNIAKLLIENGANLNMKNDHGYTPLYYTVTLNKPKITKLLIANGADVNIRMYGETLLHYVCRNRYTHIAKLLIANGADVNIKDRFGHTPLYNASYYGDTDIVKLLITNGAEVNIKDYNSITPLDYAYVNKNENIVKLLLANGAEVDEKTNEFLNDNNKKQ